MRAVLWRPGSESGPPTLPWGAQGGRRSGQRHGGSARPHITILGAKLSCHVGGSRQRCPSCCLLDWLLGAASAAALREQDSRATRYTWRTSPSLPDEGRPLARS